MFVIIELLNGQGGGLPILTFGYCRRQVFETQNFKLRTND